MNNTPKRFLTLAASAVILSSLVLGGCQLATQPAETHTSAQDQMNADMQLQLQGLQTRLDILTQLINLRDTTDCNLAAQTGLNGKITSALQEVQESATQLETTAGAQGPAGAPGAAGTPGAPSTAGTGGSIINVGATGNAPTDATSSTSPGGTTTEPGVNQLVTPPTPTVPGQIVIPPAPPAPPVSPPVVPMLPPTPEVL